MGELAGLVAEGIGAALDPVLFGLSVLAFTMAQKADGGRARWWTPVTALLAGALTMALGAAPDRSPRPHGYWVDRSAAEWIAAMIQTWAYIGIRASLRSRPVPPPS